MEFVLVILAAAGTFGLCFLVDKGFTKIFRSKAQHKSGLSVRANKRYAVVGLLLAVLSIAAVLNSLDGEWLLLAGGCLLALVGVFLIVYYMTFGIFYDDESFILTTFGKKSTIYRYADIKAQQLYVTYGNVIIELHMTDGRTVQLHANMEGAYPFLDKAYAAWLVQKGLTEEECAFHDPSNSCWFPPVED